MTQSTASEGTGPWRNRVRRYALSAGNFALLQALVTILFAMIQGKVSAAFPCHRYDSLFHVPMIIVVLSFSGALSFSCIAVLLGLIAWRLRPFLSGLVSIGILWGLIVANLRNYTPVDPDSTAQLTLTTISHAEITYYSMAERYGSFEDLIREQLLDDRDWLNSNRSYEFSLAASELHFEARARKTGERGCWSYVIREDGVLRYLSDSPRGKSDDRVY